MHPCGLQGQYKYIQGLIKYYGHFRQGSATSFDTLDSQFGHGIREVYIDDRPITCHKGQEEYT